jgi:type I restriction enzyme S subunit
MSAVKDARYATYKDSGIELLGKFPQHWLVCKLKDITFYQEGPGIMADDFQNEGVPLIRISGMKGDVVSLEGCNFLDPVKVKKKWSHFQLRQGELLVSASATTGIAAKVNEDVIGAIPYTGLIRFKPRTKLNLTYLQYLLTANIFTAQIDLQKSGTTIQHYGPTHLGRVFAVLPPRNEQTAIAAYLDTKTAQIDRQIDLLIQKATQYGNLKQSLIYETVTSGLDKSVPMKDSGVEWIGNVPEHWEVRRINDVAIQNKRKNNNLIETNLLSLSYGRIIRKDFNSSFGLLPESFETYQVVNAGTVILRLTDLQNDQRSLRVGLASERGIITSAYLGLVFNSSINSNFAYYLLHVYDLAKVFYWFGGGLRSTMRFDDIKVIPFVIPPVDEQKAITKYLDEKTAQIDRIITAINAQIDKLRDLRKALINDMVTGKIKIASEGVSI